MDDDPVKDDPTPSTSPVSCGGGVTATPPETCAEAVRKADAATEAAKKKTADASALYARLVTATSVSGGVPAGDMAVTPGVKAEHKGIETLRKEGDTWLKFAGESNKIGTVEVGTKNTGYYPLEDASSGPHAVKASAFTQRVGQKHDTGASFAGTYMGVEGMFKCTKAAGCTSSPAAGEDMFTLPDGEWHFKPTSAEDRLEGAKVAEWGWWMAGSTATPSVAVAGAVNLRYAVFNPVNGQPENPQQSFPSAGEATYSGAAHGQYAIVDGADSESGAFEATASLTARFRGNTNTELSGWVHDFDVNSGWEVMLKEDKMHSSGVFAGKTVWKTGDEDGLGQGDWKASMYGGSSSTESTHVVGGFAATDAGARMVGAFGAEPPKQE